MAYESFGAKLQRAWASSSSRAGWQRALDGEEARLRHRLADPEYAARLMPPPLTSEGGPPHGLPGTNPR